MKSSFYIIKKLLSLLLVLSFTAALAGACTVKPAGNDPEQEAAKSEAPELTEPASDESSPEPELTAEPAPSAEANAPQGQFDTIFMDEKKTMSLCTHILDAEFVGIGKIVEVPYFLFKPLELIKGNLSGDEAGEIYVSVPNALMDFKKDFTNPFEEGGVYLLALERHLSVFNPCATFYPLFEDRIIAQDDEHWDELHDVARYVAANTVWKDSINSTPFSDSSDPEEIAAFANTIVVAELKGEGDVAADKGLMLGTYKVNRTLKGSSVNELTFSVFTGMVEPGQEYVFLLYRNSQSSKAAAPAARENFVLTIEQAMNYPSLRALLEG